MNNNEFTKIFRDAVAKAIANRFTKGLGISVWQNGKVVKVYGK